MLPPPTTIACALAHGLARFSCGMDAGHADSQRSEDGAHLLDELVMALGHGSVRNEQDFPHAFPEKGLEVSARVLQVLHTLALCIAQQQQPHGSFPIR